MSLTKLSHTICIRESRCAYTVNALVLLPTTKILQWVLVIDSGGPMPPHTDILITLMIVLEYANGCSMQE